MYTKQLCALAVIPFAAQARSGMVDMNGPAMSLMNLASGTAVNPASAFPPMIMEHYGKWNTMLMGTAFVVDTQQSGPRGGDKFFSTNWFMGSIEHRAGKKGAFETELMLSLEPATVTNRRYPELFQTGETAFGVPLTDAQHPHNFIMSLGFHYNYQLAPATQLQLYFAPVGDPALGPVAFPHRASAVELPQAPLSHHWQDSTHIADEVATVGVQHKKIKVEASGFHGAEPGEDRWIISAGPIDSWAARLWLFPSANWAMQVSGGRISHPEATEPGDQTRTTASVHYSRPMQGAYWSSSVIWGRNHHTATHRDTNSYLAESVVPIRSVNFVTGRVELVDKDELFAAEPRVEEQLAATAGSTFRVASVTLGYTRDVRIWDRVQTGIGANFTLYAVPGPIQPFYGTHPVGGNLLIRFRLQPHRG